MSTPAGAQPLKPDLTSTRLWVTAVSLVHQAEELTERGAAVDQASAVILADVASETLLGLLAGPTQIAQTPAPGQPKNKLPQEGYQAWLHIVARRLRMNAATRQKLGNARDVRNNVVHGGLVPGRLEAEKATEAARALLELVPRGLRALKLLPPGAGLGNAIASVLNPHPAGGYLERAQRALDRQRSVEAIEEAAGAFDAAISSLRPGLFRPGSLVAPRSRDPEAQRLFEQMRHSFESIEAWLTPMALGVNPAEFRRLRERLPGVLPSVVRPGVSHYCWRNGPDGSGARQVVEEVGWLLLRLWERGVLSVSVTSPPWAGALPRDLLTVVTPVELDRSTPEQSGGCVLLVIGDHEVHRVSLSIHADGVTVLGADRVLLDGVPTLVRQSPPWTLTVDVGTSSQSIRELFVGGIQYTVAADAVLGAIPTEVSTISHNGGGTQHIASAAWIVG